jgi:hypothetical protein
MKRSSPTTVTITAEYADFHFGDFEGSLFERSCSDENSYCARRKESVVWGGVLN